VKDKMTMPLKDHPELIKAYEQYQVFNHDERLRALYEPQQIFLHDNATDLEAAFKRDVKKAVMKYVKKGVYEWLKH